MSLKAVSYTHLDVYKRQQPPEKKVKPESPTEDKKVDKAGGIKLIPPKPKRKWFSILYYDIIFNQMKNTVIFNQMKNTELYIAYYIRNIMIK